MRLDRKIFTDNEVCSQRNVEKMRNKQYAWDDLGFIFKRTVYTDTMNLTAVHNRTFCNDGDFSI